MHNPKPHFLAHAFLCWIWWPVGPDEDPYIIYELDGVGSRVRRLPNGEAHALDPDGHPIGTFQTESAARTALQRLDVESWPLLSS